jgi:isochorismate hydrolase
MIPLATYEQLQLLADKKSVHVAIDVQRRFFLAADAGEQRYQHHADQVAKNIYAFSTGLKKYDLDTYWVFWPERGTPVDRPDFHLVKPARADMLFPKYSPSAFDRCVLGSYLEHSGVENIILSGGYSSYCVAQTAEDAMKHGYNVFVAADCVVDFFGAERTLSESFNFAAGAPYMTSSCDVLHHLGALKKSQQHQNRPSP